MVALNTSVGLVLGCGATLLLADPQAGSPLGGLLGAAGSRLQFVFTKNALDSYLEQLSRIAGAKAVTAKALKGYTWTPSQVTSAKTQIIEALEALVAAASGAEADQPAPGSFS